MATAAQRHIGASSRRTARRVDRVPHAVHRRAARCSFSGRAIPRADALFSAARRRRIPAAFHLPTAVNPRKHIPHEGTAAASGRSALPVSYRGVYDCYLLSDATGPSPRARRAGRAFFTRRSASSACPRCGSQWRCHSDSTLLLSCSRHTTPSDLAHWNTARARARDTFTRPTVATAGLSSGYAPSAATRFKATQPAGLGARRAGGLGARLAASASAGEERRRASGRCNPGSLRCRWPTNDGSGRRGRGV